MESHWRTTLRTFTETFIEWAYDMCATLPRRQSSVRIVIQHSQITHFSAFRLVAYESNRIYQPLEFQSLDQLLARIQLVKPDFHEENLAIREDPEHPYIVFTGNWQLRPVDLSTLGVVSRR